MRAENEALKAEAAARIESQAKAAEADRLRAENAALKLLLAPESRNLALPIKPIKEVERSHLETQRYRMHSSFNR